MEKVHPHTVKKFELIEAYVKEWSQKLLNNPWCSEIVFIDCMCNSGVYQDETGNEVLGTPIRVARYLGEVMKDYPEKMAQLYFNDKSNTRIEELKTHLPSNSDNFVIHTSVLDGNQLLNDFRVDNNKLSYLIVYDPYEASIDWFALLPFLRNWGDVIINHMTSDTVRAMSQVKKQTAISKYEQTYLSTLEELTLLGSDREAYEKKVQDIIKMLRGDDKGCRYYIASFPFFNSRNAIVYHLLFGTGNLEGFKTFKKVAWKIFGGKSSGKKTCGNQCQSMINTDNMTITTTPPVENCYYPKDIANYLHYRFIGQENVPLAHIWAALYEHPVFPSEGFRNEIKQCLKTTFRDQVSQSSISFVSGK